MTKKTNSNLGYYISLILVLTCGFLLASITTDRIIQTTIVFIITIFYVGWGILHHLINHDLNAKIVVEYVLIGGFGLTMIFFLLKGGLGI